MNALRSSLVFAWLVISLAPFGIALLLCSMFLPSEKLWRWFAIPWLQGVIGAARLVGGVDYEVQGQEHLPAPDDNRRIILVSKHQSTWETFFSRVTCRTCSLMFLEGASADSGFWLVYGAPGDGAY